MGFMKGVRVWIERVWERALYPKLLDSMAMKRGASDNISFYSGVLSHDDVDALAGAYATLAE